MSVLFDPLTRERKTVTPHRLAQQKNRLLRIRAGLIQRIKRLAEDAAEDTPECSLHIADAATDSFDRDLLLGLVSFEQEALYEVDAALKRIEDDTYGVCELTGQRIPWERLKAIPWARFSIEAEAELEAGIHPHIGLLRTVRQTGNEPFATAFEPEAETPSEGSIEDSPSSTVSEENT